LLIAIGLLAATPAGAAKGDLINAARADNLLVSHAILKEPDHG
jgi:hypothetical protein